MHTVAIDPTKGARKVFTLPHDLAEEVDRYRRAQPKIPSESKAFAELIRKGLERYKEEQDAAQRRRS